MGGYGSGRFGSGRKRTTGSVRQLDIHSIKPCHAPGARGTISWPSLDDEKKHEGIGFFTEKNQIIFSYAVRMGNGEQETIHQKIELTRTPCNFGGTRTWFVCPRCFRRVAILYLGGTRFYCRRCYGLAYPSQQEGIADRLQRKARKIRKRLGADDNFMIPIWRRPKGMHQKTFERLRKEADLAYEQSWRISLERSHLLTRMRRMNLDVDGLSDSFGW